MNKLQLNCFFRGLPIFLRETAFPFVLRPLLKFGALLLGGVALMSIYSPLMLVLALLITNMPGVKPSAVIAARIAHLEVFVGVSAAVWACIGAVYLYRRIVNVGERSAAAAEATRRMHAAGEEAAAILLAAKLESEAHPSDRVRKTGPRMEP